MESPKPLKPARFGRSENLRVGDWVLAIGNPFGFGGSVTAGIVSALDRDINSGPYDHYIQTDASINRGNSGGPLFNIEGEVVGINTAIMSPTGGSIGIGFSVPSEIAVPVIEQLRRFGAVRRGWIGVRIQDVTDEVAEGLGMENATGAFIAGMTEDGPAAKAGVKEGDVVVEFNGKKVETMRALPRLVADTPPGDSVEMTVMRDGKPVMLSIEVGLLEDKPVETASAEPGAESAPPPVDAAQMFGLTAWCDHGRRAQELLDRFKRPGRACHRGRSRKRGGGQEPQARRGHRAGESDGRHEAGRSDRPYRGAQVGRAPHGDAARVRRKQQASLRVASFRGFAVTLAPGARRR